MVCSQCNRNEDIVFKRETRIDLTRQISESDYFCRDCFLLQIEKRAFREFENHGIKEDKKILVAFSGEKDSTFLLILLSKFRQNIAKNLDIHAVLVMDGYGNISCSRRVAAKKISNMFDIPLTILSHSTIFGEELEDIYKRLKLQYGITDTSYCKLCTDLRKIILLNIQKIKDFDMVLVGQNKDDIINDILLSTITPPFSGYVQIKDNVMVEAVKIFSNEEINVFLDILEIEYSKESCKLKKLMPRRQISRGLEEASNHIYALKSRINTAVQKNIDKIILEIPYTRCPNCNMYLAKDNLDCKKCKLLNLYGICTEVMKDSIRKLRFLNNRH